MAEINTDERRTPWWPFVLGGAVAPLGSLSLSPWLPHPFATAVSFFAAFFAANWLFEWSSGRVHRIVLNCAASGAGAIVSGVITFLFSR